MLAALGHLTSHDRIDPKNLFLFGQSLGGAISLDLYARRPSFFKGIILENTFTSLKRLMKKSGGALVSPLLSTLSEPWDNLASIDTLGTNYGKVLLLSGRKDDFVPPQHMDSLLERFLEYKRDNAAQSVQMVQIPNGGHIEMYNEPGYFDAFKSFFSKQQIQN
jgi:pimeloyl-ACP methyl ester carboxylesterase